MGMSLCRLCIKIRNDLLRAIQNVWQQIEEDRIRKLYHSIPSLDNGIKIKSHLAVHKMDFRKETSRFEVFIELFLDQLNRPLQPSQNIVTSRALASLGLSACGSAMYVTEIICIAHFKFIVDDWN